jgi:hypothetical protein
MLIFSDIGGSESGQAIEKAHIAAAKKAIDVFLQMEKM